MDRIFGHSIEHFREKKKMTQTQAAKLAGITQSQLSRIEDGENWPNKSTLRKICRGLGISGNEFFNHMGHHLIDMSNHGEIWMLDDED
ncbi:MAG: helix-turn-helix transcriptional regulator [Lachnospiraceae bacterium]|nr:helix-turn-helix transcriptional regulator [Lachnospiraceae bacterium]